MAKSKYHHYVLVCTTSGAKFVTKLLPHHECEWIATDAPLEMSPQWAEDVAMGLMLNFHCAFHIKVPFEIDRQPYYYEHGHFEWVDDSDKN